MPDAVALLGFPCEGTGKPSPDAARSREEGREGSVLLARLREICDEGGRRW